MKQRHTVALIDSLAQECEPARRILRDSSARVAGQKESAEGGLRSGVAQVRSFLKPNSSLRSVLRHAPTGVVAHSKLRRAARVCVDLGRLAVAPPRDLVAVREYERLVRDRIPQAHVEEPRVTL